MKIQSEARFLQQFFYHKPGWQKTGFFVGARKLNLKFPVKIFTCFCCLTTTHQPNPPTPNTYSYLPFKSSKFLFVKECNKEY